MSEPTESENVCSECGWTETTLEDAVALEPGEDGAARCPECGARVTSEYE